MNTNILCAILFISILSSSFQTEGKKGICVLKGPNDVSGEIKFVQNKSDQPVQITGVVTGLSEGDHGFHIHEKGDLTNGCTSTGSHYNPDKKNHGSPNGQNRHVGDLGNIKASKDGVSQMNITDNVITLYGNRSVLGRAVVVHSDVDDFGQGGFSDSLTTGHAGSRVACCIIGIQ